MQPGKENIRIDKFLWATRIFKSRSLAAEACKKGRITVNNSPAKPSRTVTIKDVIEVKRPPASFVYEVINLTENRIPAKMVNQFINDLTPEEEKVKLASVTGHDFVFRPRGKGRPTKKERRDIDRLYNSIDGF